MAPISLLFFQNKPAVRGTNNATRLNAEDSLTNSKIELLENERIIAMIVIKIVDNRMIFKSFWSEILPPDKGLIRFSAITVAGANIAALQVLNMAEINDPKNMI